MIEDLARACVSELVELPPGERFDQHRPRLEQALVKQNRLAVAVIEKWAGLLD
jgi:hypothetical protein